MTIVTACSPRHCTQHRKVDAMAGVAGGLLSLHRGGIVHGDFKLAQVCMLLLLPGHCQRDPPFGAILQLLRATHAVATAAV